jgi:hypothetical protein
LDGGRKKAPLSPFQIRKCAGGVTKVYKRIVIEAATPILAGSSNYNNCVA